MALFHTAERNAGQNQRDQLNTATTVGKSHTFAEIPDVKKLHPNI